ncbi:hypothetical protein SALBM135S_08968 [Streptomyces alboniger]
MYLLASALGYGYDLEVTAVALSISAVVLLAIIVFLLVKKSGLKAGHAVVCTLLGFYLASSSIAPTINELTTNVAGMIGDIKF